ncbi:PTS sugar transporter subunit IIC [Clostridioides sp. ES-S-0108-01]|uniref:PTS mannose/fructose/sorbose/N-acetylgalactosamine transporter subunit IIC n=1 Tax=unclassified Clostridioides TaxID=2635829 RepID=UPI001D0C8658|nr:PTS sugar transporter subunit IIC [Clostridioides sp. ES-S-0171-01]MCC0689823.1 PTS sugar transporter subunit IIC [Clostridioides sp. ES-S-0056-01]MCC0715662.1 PTS sugar transporter subunit IIC [Clostridioides sp. ES-S-0077-01]MCC0784908.1 PTS sugar transporter subunit IIC [Clostridioides sp. ES-S-0108-01]UDN50976.1 PTS sugar transporter subunit IIC [Clostridioides sp. ES-S-0107-01]UDN54464.1 PTS sugar transporter subunit IIC [Clostridioides sp. ES-S-0054-01]
MLFQSILLGLIGVFCILDSRLLGRLNFERPLIVSTLVGIVLGDMEKGLMVGASLELMSLGIVNIGAAAPPDMNMGSIIATAFAILSNSDAETALTIAIPIAVFGQMLAILIRTILSKMTHTSDYFIEKGEYKNACRVHIIWGPILYSFMYFLPIFLAIYFGTDLVKSIVDNIPGWLTNGLTLASKILPAYGFALLLSTMLSGKMLPFLLIGFFITAYSGLSVTGIAIFACTLSFILAEFKFKKENQSVDELDSINDFDTL